MIRINVLGLFSCYLIIMIFNLNTKSLSLDETALERIKEGLRVVEKHLPHIDKDLQLSLLIKKAHSKFHPKAKYKDGKDYLETKLKQANFEGWVKLTLPKKVLYTHFQGLTVKGAISQARKTLLKEIKKYKELHFKSLSKYPHHETIRRAM